MNKLDQFYRMLQLLDGRKFPISVAELAEHLECTERTVRRYLDELRDYWNAPLVNIPREGWQLDAAPKEKWLVPGLWMTAEESQSLLLMLDILTRFGNGLMNEEFRSVRSSIDKSLQQRGISRAELEARIKVVPIGQRFVPDARLQQSLSALVQSKRLFIHYRDYDLVESKRTISPQRLVYYRDNWYLDAWCHTAEGLRTFCLARIIAGDITNTNAKVIPHDVLDREFTGTYGMFAGQPTARAVLRFLPAVATEISRQEWHPDQSGQWDGDDYVLTVPFSHQAELIQDILRYSPHVRVEAPRDLVQEVRARLQAAVSLYGEAG